MLLPVGGPSGSRPEPLPPAPPSLPALAWALQGHAWLPERAADPPTPGGVAGNRARPLDALRTLAPAWRVPPSDPAAQAQAAAHVVRHAADRLRRLANAYAEWPTFDAAAYFDLTLPQTELLVQVVERVRLAHVTFHADLLLPAYQEAVRVWAEEWAPAQAGLSTGRVEALIAYEAAHIALRSALEHAADLLQRTRRLLLGDIGFLAANGAEEERARWALDGIVYPLPSHALPTLTLTMDFPLPSARQPGRLRRLRRHRDRRDRRHHRGHGP